jgi:hypothetical protein
MKLKQGIFTSEFWLVLLFVLPELVTNFLELWRNGTAGLDRGDISGFVLVAVYTAARTAQKYIPVLFTKYAFPSEITAGGNVEVTQPQG